MARALRIPHVAMFFGATLALSGFVVGCDDAPAPAAAPPPPARRAAAAPSASASASASVVRTYGQEEFTPSDRNRDPFRNYPEKFKQRQQDTTIQQVKSLADVYALDELKLVAIVSSGAPRAMFVDPQGKGWIVTVGQRVGRSELVRATGSNGPEYDVSWKVDRIRESDVVFVRDTTNANVPASNKVVALRIDDARKRLGVRLAISRRVPIGAREFPLVPPSRGRSAALFLTPRTWPSPRLPAYDSHPVRRVRDP